MGEAVRRIVRLGRRIGLDALTLYAFSFQNWSRPEDEVGALMSLLYDYLVTERQREQVQGVADKMAGAKVVIKARCSATGKLFGSITNRQVASVMEEQTGEEIDRHKIVIDDRIRSVGHYHATIKLHPDVEFDVEFEVEGEGFVAEEPEGEADEAVESAEVQAEDAAEPEPAQETEAAASEAELEIAAETEDSGE